MERFRLDKDLAGRDTPLGPVPSTPRPIFRDRAEFDAGGSLAALTRTALEGSDSLILLASPDAAASHYVNEEVRLFRHLHPDRPVIPLIVAGKDGVTAVDVFPPALRFRLDPDGAITDTPEDDRVAPDERDNGDGRDLAFSKVVPRLIGVGPDEVFRRAEQERRRQARLRSEIAAVIVFLCAGGGYATWMYWRTDQSRVVAERELTDARALANKLLGANPARAAAPGAAESLTKAIAAIAANAGTDERQARALALIKEGKTEEAAALLQAVAQDAESAATRDRKRAAEAYRSLGSIAGLRDPKKAREAYAAAARLDPDDVEGMYWFGSFEADAGDLAQAEAAFRHVVEPGKPGKDDSALYWAGLGLGDIQSLRGDLKAARATDDQAAAIAERLEKADPGNAGWQRDLSVSHAKLGDAYRRSNDLAQAREHLIAGRAIIAGLVEKYPDWAQWKTDLVWFDEQLQSLK